MSNVRIAVKSFIVNDKKELLLIKRRPNDVHKPGVWEIPGGRLDIGENPFVGLQRETKEETGLDISIIHPLQIQHFTRDDGQQITMIIFYCTPQSFDVQLSNEHTEFMWKPITEAKLHIHEPFHKTVDAFTSVFL